VQRIHGVIHQLPDLQAAAAAHMGITHSSMSHNPSINQRGDPLIWRLNSLALHVAACGVGTPAEPTDMSDIARAVRQSYSCQDTA
jgi:hypothetical protein